VEKIEQFYCEVRSSAKLSALLQLMQEKQFGLSLVFVATKVMADSLATQLTEAGHPAEAIHGDLRQRQRDKVMQRYRDGKVKILVATDVAARGIDVDGIDAVVNYDIPSDPDSYVHRIGRTGRANQSGAAYTLIYPRERGKLQGIMRTTKASILPMALDSKVIFPEFPVFQKQPQQQNDGRSRQKSSKSFAKKSREKNGYDKKNYGKRDRSYAARH
jgi:ATP-dependent RNA helicase DeaD